MQPSRYSFYYLFYSYCFDGENLFHDPKLLLKYGYHVLKILPYYIWSLKYVWFIFYLYIVNIPFIWLFIWKKWFIQDVFSSRYLFYTLDAQEHNFETCSFIKILNLLGFVCLLHNNLFFYTAVVQFHKHWRVLNHVISSKNSQQRCM